MAAKFVFFFEKSKEKARKVGFKGEKCFFLSLFFVRTQTFFIFDN